MDLIKSNETMSLTNYSEDRFLLKSGEWSRKYSHKELLTFSDSDSAFKFVSKFVELFPQVKVSPISKPKPNLKLKQKEKWIMEWIVEGIDLEVGSEDLSQASLTLDGEVYFTISEELLNGLVDKGLIIDYKFARVDHELYEVSLEVCPQTLLSWYAT